MTSAPPVLAGVQTPRVSSVPPSRSSAGDEAIELADRAGLHLMPWQQVVVRDALGETAGRWAAFEVGLVVPRQQGKGSILEALELAALFLADPDLPPPLILHSAHEFRTSAEHFRRVRDLVESNAFLKRRVRIIRTAAGAESIELHSGARLRFITRTGGSGRGFSADLVVIDEAYNLTAESMAAVLPTLAARPNPQIWYTSSAGMSSSEALANIRRRGQAGGDPSLAYFEWSATDGSDLDDRQAWAQANPSLGYRVPESFIERERAALPDEQFGRERLGLWADKSDHSPDAFDDRVWKAAGDASASRGTDVSFGVATAADRSWSAIGVAWRRPDGRVQVMLARYDRGASWVDTRVAELRARWTPRTVLTDTASKGIAPGAAALSESDQTIAENGLADLLEADGLRHGNEPALNTAVRGARWRPTSTSRRLDHKGDVDISPLRAVALAAHGLRTAAGPSAYERDGFTVL